MSIKAYDWFITELHPFDALNKTKCLLNKAFYSKMIEMIHECESVLKNNTDATWEDDGFEYYNSSKKNSSIKIRDFGCVLPVSCSKYVDYLRDMDNTYSVANFGYKILFIDGPKDRGYRTTLFKVLSRDDSYTKSLNMEDWCKDFSYQNYGDQISNVSSEEWRRRETFWSSVYFSEYSDMGFTAFNPSKTEVILHFSSR